MNTARQITPDGKPMRALRALAKTDPAQPLTEHGVWIVASSNRGESVPVNWHAALATLVSRDLAIRCGRRGGYEWYITDRGRALLDARS